MSFGEKEIFVDAGCADLGSSLILKEYCKKCKVYAFEPDELLFAKSLETAREHFTEGTARVINKGTWSKPDTLSFTATGDGMSRLEDGGMSQIEVAMIDKEINEPVTFIKMDVEGAELESLQGAAETIRRNHPKLAICILS